MSDAFAVSDSLDKNMGMSEDYRKAKAKERGGLNIYQKWIDLWCEVGDGYYEKSAVLAKNFNEFAREEFNYNRNWNGFQTKTIGEKLGEK
ncbi:hypothetical protein [Candidatus Liberibacter sp.]|uniref:hypothetical protein n=1 Tax=Candidatus Liberibacter sp. TaxID=34022 RepID=UPI0015F654CE|nr:hypothetical protein [Candidatus Liberibacter sp.]MBA5724041.1 hypothetical protein [Candidatus Liberibacter sp.]